MTTDLDCRLGLVSQGLEAQLPALATLPKFIHDQLAFFSHDAINLKVSQPTLMPNASAVGAQVSALQLHTQLLQINQNPLNGPLRSICVLLAHSYSGLPGAFGIMFDRGFITTDDPNSAPLFLQRPRQGCAVFLGQIATQRSSDQFASEVLFTTLHELGHVFNLQHDEASLNFMRTSEAQAFGPPAFHYTPFQQTRLASCGVDPHVTPGDSIFDSDGAFNLDTPAPPPLGDALRLELSSARASFWRFEPIQIEIGLSSTRAGKQAVSIPAVIDPSQTRFRLMIENDRGERKLYRSPYRVCGGDQTLKITAKQPYRRDFPIFGQSGGYTFQRAGRHVIRAELDLGETLLRSNELVLDIQREIGLGMADQKLRSVLSDPRVGSLLFHREDCHKRIAFAKLSRFVERARSIPSIGEINYSLARAQLRAHSSGNTWGSHRRASLFLERALASEDMGPRSRAKATQLLREIDACAIARPKRTPGVKKARRQGITSAKPNR